VGKLYFDGFAEPFLFGCGPPAILADETGRGHDIAEYFQIFGVTAFIPFT
jgi:hypothetical protein